MRWAAQRTKVKWGSSSTTSTTPFASNRGAKK
jgi:hypothetical protein